MLRLSVLDKRIDDIRAAKAKQSALVAKLTAPQIELERLAQLEAELTAAKAAAEQEAQSLEAERASIVQDLALFEAIEKDHAAWLRYMDRLIAICEHGMLSAPAPIVRARVIGNTDAPEHAATLRARLAGVDRRLKELDQ